MTEGMTQMLESLNYIFTGIFTAEFFIKIIGYGYRYFRETWNIFDMVIVILTIIGIIIGQASDLDVGPQTTIIRSFRIARIFYLFKRNKALRSTFITFLLSLTGLVNIGSLILLIIFMYSVLAVYLFAPVKLNGELNEQANF
jgi:Ion transport protein